MECRNIVFRREVSSTVLNAFRPFMMAFNSSFVGQTIKQFTKGYVGRWLRHLRENCTGQFVAKTRRKCYTLLVDEGRKRVIAIVAAILAARKLAQ
jgi:hypothetical protein